MTPYEQGFIAKCAEYGVSEQVAKSMLKTAMSASDVREVVESAANVADIGGGLPSAASKALGAYGGAMTGWSLGRAIGEGVTVGGRTVDDRLQRVLGADSGVDSVNAPGNGGVRIDPSRAGDIAASAAASGAALASASSIPAVAAAGGVAGSGMAGWGIGRLLGRNAKWSGKTLDEHVRDEFEKAMDSEAGRSMAADAHGMQPTRLVMR